MAIALAQEPRQPLVTLHIHRIGEQRIAIERFQSRADDQLDPLFDRYRRQAFLFFLFVILVHRRIGAHDTGQRIAVGDADRVMAERDRLLDQLARMRAATQEAVVGGDLELGLTHGLRCLCRPERSEKPHA
jgi:hypothetical protein